MSVVSQESVLFSRTIAENIKYGCEQASDEDMYRAAKMAAVHDDITGFPSGYQTGGAHVSYHTCHACSQRVLIIITQPAVKNAFCPCLTDEMS